MRLLACLLAASCWAQTSNFDRVWEELGQVRPFHGVAISPDGSRVAWIDAHSVIYSSDAHAGAAPARIAAGDHIAWSPDGRRIAFFSREESPGQPQLYVAPATGGAAQRLTDLTGYLADPLWSRDGTRIAVLFAENAHGGGGPLEAVPAETGVIQSDIHNQRIFVIDAASGKGAQVSPPDLNVYEYDWSPDGRAFVFTAAPGPADNNWWLAQLYTMPSDSGPPRSIYRPPVRRQLAVPRWSPDGARIAFIGGLMSDAGFTGGDIFTIRAGGGEPRNRTPGRKSSPSSIAWISPSKLLFTETAGGGSAIATLDLGTGRFETLWSGESDVHAAGNFPNFSVTRDGAACALIPSSWTEAPDVWAGPIGKWRRITKTNAGLRPGWGEAKSVKWKNEGFDVQGWLVYPAPYDPARRYPMVVAVHGGPAGAKRSAWPSGFFDPTILSAEGYFVFFPNPRGSYGSGEDFVQANVKDFGGGDLRDILAGVDYIAKSHPVDPARVGITGWSYGGFMTMWAVTQTGRFRAAVAGAGLANWQSYYGENSIDQWMIPYFGATVYDDPAVYAKSSPINFIKRAKTPSLVLVGERDGECPAPQSFEFWHALKTLGVPAELVVYPGEGHMFRNPEHQRDAMRRTVEWFDRYLKK